MEHIMAVLFGPSPPLVGVTVLHHWNTPHTHTHTVAHTVWWRPCGLKRFTRVLTTERYTAYSSWQSIDMFGGYVLLVPRRPLHYVHPHCERCLLIRVHCASCRHSSSPRTCVSTSHHFHIESTLPHLYKKLCRSSQAILQYSD